MTTTPPRRALVVIDVQNEYIDGRFRIEYPSVATSLPWIERAMDASAEAGIPVVVVQHVLDADAPIFARGSRGVELHPAIGGRHRDHLVHKTLPSCFTGTDLQDWLTARGIDTLAIVGYMTHNCDDSTTREAMHRGYRVEVLSDATGSLPYANSAGIASAEQIHRTTLVVLQSTFAAVVTTAEWLSAVAGGEALAPDNIFASNQRALGTSASVL
ncbi:MAG: cysteine hydrolase family protein [Rhizobacter sp.]